MALLAALALLRCSVSADDAASAGNSGDWNGATGTGGAAFVGGTGGAPEEIPPEVELEDTFRSPVATGEYVWAANPTTDRVALVNASNLTVRSVEAGQGPTYLAAVPSPDDLTVNRAIVVNVESGDASLLTEDGSEVVEQRIPLHPQANSWAVSSSGRFAIAWTDADTLTASDPTEGFQGLTVIRIPPASALAEQAAAFRLTAGYRPSRVFISTDEARAFVVSETGITIVALGDVPTVLEDVALGAVSGVEATARDVSVTPDGRFALVRRDGSPRVEILDLTSGVSRSVELSGPVTDLDLTSDGTCAIAVVRQITTLGAGGAPGVGGSGTSEGQAGAAGSTGAPGAGAPAAGAAGSGGTSPVPVLGSSEVAILRLPAAFDDPAAFDRVVITDHVVGSVATSLAGDRALLFVNGTPSDLLTILNTAPGATYLESRVVPLDAPVQSVYPTPNAAHAIALLAPDPATSSAPGAFSVVPIDRDLPPKLQDTTAAPLSVTLTNTRGVVTVRDRTTQAYGAYVVRLPELQVDAVPLASPPLASGLVPAAERAFVAQEHPEGRITFIHLRAERGDPELVQTLTGFELATRVVGDAGDGS